MSKLIFGKTVANAIFPPVKILFGGLYPFFLVTFFGVLERIILKITLKK